MLMMITKSLFLFLLSLANMHLIFKEKRSVESRLADSPPEVCCRCIDKNAVCNNKIAKNDTALGINCNSIECDLFNDCDPKIKGCKVGQIKVVEVSDVFDLRSPEKCGFDEKVCCNPGPGGAFINEIPQFDVNSFEDDQVVVDTVAICGKPNLQAVEDFGHGITCGKRDSR